MEHTTPRSSGGATDAQNLALSCGGCNGHKGARISIQDPQNQQTIALFNPRRDFWHDHFAWSEDFQLIIGLSAIGRATIEALQVNRTALRNLRWLLATQNLHPPAD